MFLDVVKQQTRARAIPVHKLVTHMTDVLAESNGAEYAVLREWFGKGFYVNRTMALCLPKSVVGNELRLVVELRLNQMHKAKMKRAAPIGVYDAFLVHYTKTQPPFNALEYRVDDSETPITVSLHSDGKHVIQVSMVNRAVAGVPGRTYLYDARLYRTVYHYWPDAVLRLGLDRTANNVFCTWYDGGGKQVAYLMPVV